jgi:hypothetical protein
MPDIVKRGGRIDELVHSRWCVRDPLPRSARVSPSRGEINACNVRALFSPSLRGRAAEGGRGLLTHHLGIGVGLNTPLQPW